MDRDDQDFRIEEKGKAESEDSPGDGLQSQESVQTEGPVTENKQAPRDRLAFGVFVVALIALFITGYLGIKAIKRDFISGRPSQLISKWLSDLEQYGKGQLGEKIKKIRPEQKKSKEAQKYIILGYNLHQKNKYTNALEAYDKAIEIDPENPEAYFWRGQSLIKTGQYEKAIVDFKRAMKIRPDYVEAYENLGWLFARIDNCEESIAYLTKSIALKSENGWAYHNRGYCYFKTGNLEKALEDAKKACELRYKDGCKAYEEYKKKGSQ